MASICQLQTVSDTQTPSRMAVMLTTRDGD
jgi:hypothetical protein